MLNKCYLSSGDTQDEQNKQTMTVRNDTSLTESWEVQPKMAPMQVLLEEIDSTDVNLLESTC